MRATLKFAPGYESSKGYEWASSALFQALERWRCLPTHVILLHKDHPDFGRFNFVLFPDATYGLCPSGYSSSNMVSAVALAYNLPFISQALHRYPAEDRASQLREQLCLTAARDADTLKLCLHVVLEGSEYQELSLAQAADELRQRDVSRQAHAVARGIREATPGDELPT
jgi:hypothetical protein